MYMIKYTISYISTHTYILHIYIYIYIWYTHTTSYTYIYIYIYIYIYDQIYDPASGCVKMNHSMPQAAAAQQSTARRGAAWRGVAYIYIYIYI